MGLDLAGIDYLLATASVYPFWLFWSNEQMPLITILPNLRTRITGTSQASHERKVMIVNLVFINPPKTCTST